MIIFDFQQPNKGWSKTLQKTLKNNTIMKKTLFTLAFITSLAITAQSTWKSDGAHSKVGFAITHLMISEVEGHFGEFDISATATDTFDNASAWQSGMSSWVRFAA